MNDAVAAGALVLRGDLVLLVQEDQSDPRYGKVAGMWSLPVGHIREGEQEQETALRETLEEAGYQVRILSDLGLFPVNEVLVRIFVGEPILQGGPPELPVRWMQDSEILDLPDREVRTPTKDALHALKKQQTQLTAR